MKCPFCKHDKTGVLDTRKFETCIVRVRICDNCHVPFKTFETVDKKSFDLQQDLSLNSAKFDRKQD